MRKICAGLLVALAGVFGLSAAAGAAPLNPDEFAAVLPSGHCIVADSRAAVVELRSPARRTTLDLFADGTLTLQSEVTVRRGGIAEYPTWNAANADLNARRSTLCMQRNGDLVLRRSGHVTFRTHTAGTAVHGHAQLINSGALVVRTTQNRTVWSTHTTGVLMVAGDRLTAGGSLVNRTYPHSWTTLEMRRSGDLVLLRNSHVVWHTGTHTAGSYLLVTTSGRIDILNPQHRVIWRSQAVGANAVFTVAQSGRITLGDFYHLRCWQRPLPAESCGRG